MLLSLCTETRKTKPHAPEKWRLALHETWWNMFWTWMTCILFRLLLEKFCSHLAHFGIRIDSWNLGWLFKHQLAGHMSTAASHGWSMAIWGDILTFLDPGGAYFLVIDDMYTPLICTIFHGCIPWIYPIWIPISGDTKSHAVSYARILDLLSVPLQNLLQFELRKQLLEAASRVDWIFFSCAHVSFRVFSQDLTSI
jgi:hypothetical protein